MKDTQKDPDFCVVARVEAFISGWGLDEALKRAEAYVNAGADAILMHSKKSDPSDIESFMKAWNNKVDKRIKFLFLIFKILFLKGPVVIVPTKYYKTPTNVFQDLGISMVIWANHNLRASVSAMQQVTKRIYADTSLINIEEKVFQKRFNK
jgi:phosphoenolpyruvate phosphomutase